MARPSKKELRSEEILDACERSIVQFGVAGATLQRVADESGLARPLLHHYVGNREDLIAAVVVRFTERAMAEDAAFKQHLPDKHRTRAAIQLLFDPRYASSSHDIQLFQALMVAAEEQAELKVVLAGWYQAFVDDMEAMLSADFPRVTASARRAVATGIVALYFNADSMASLVSPQPLFKDSKQAALQLLETMQ
ncbi:MAG: TetR family transcriptional regulator [Pseudomonadota bacterium]